VLGFSWLFYVVVQGYKEQNDAWTSSGRSVRGVPGGRVGDGGDVAAGECEFVPAFSQISSNAFLVSSFNVIVISTVLMIIHLQSF